MCRYLDLHFFCTMTMAKYCAHSSFTRRSFRSSPFDVLYYHLGSKKAPPPPPPPPPPPQPAQTNHPPPRILTTGSVRFIDHRLLQAHLILYHWRLCLFRIGHIPPRRHLCRQLRWIHTNYWNRVVVKLCGASGRRRCVSSASAPARGCSGQYSESRHGGI